MLLYVADGRLYGRTVCYELFSYFTITFLPLWI